MLVPKERQFIGFDAYRHAMDCLKPGDIAIFATPLAFRWVHFGYAIEKGLHVFMEKPLTADGPTSRKMLDLAKQADQKNLKVGVGLMSRHNRALEQLADRIHGGEIGDLVLLRGYRMHGPAASFRSLRKPDGISEVAYQIQRFHSFLWASGGCFSDFNIHIIDHCCWMKNAWPIEAQGVGGRHYRGDYVDQNFDSYSVEYSFADGSRFIMDGRCIAGWRRILSIASLTARRARQSSRVPATAVRPRQRSKDSVRRARTAFGNRKRPPARRARTAMNGTTLSMRFSTISRTMKCLGASRQSLVDLDGPPRAHTGRTVTRDELLGSDHAFAPECGQADNGRPGASLLAGRKRSLPPCRSPALSPATRVLRAINSVGWTSESVHIFHAWTDSEVHPTHSIILQAVSGAIWLARPFAGSSERAVPTKAAAKNRRRSQNRVEM